MFCILIRQMAPSGSAVAFASKLKLLTCDHITLIFDLSTSERGHGSAVSLAFFLLQLGTTFHSRLRMTYGQTD